MTELDKSAQDVHTSGITSPEPDCIMLPFQRHPLIIAHPKRINPGRYLGTVQIAEALFHMDLIEVYDDEAKGQIARHDDNYDTFSDMQNYYDGIYQTITYNDRQYACFIYPYCE